MKAMYCPCGERILGEDDDDLVDKADEHLRTEHPQMAGKYSREEILILAFDL